MKLDRRDLELYVVTDRQWLNGKDFLNELELILKNGATMIQLREKNLPKEALVELAFQVLKVCRTYHVPLIINDEVDVAIEVDADGVHVGQSDLEAAQVRQKMGANKILGVSVQTVEQAQCAKRHGADYIGVGTLFHTTTKKDAKQVSLQTLGDIVNEVNIPVVGIGGIDESTLLQLEHLNLDGVALISAIFAKDDVGKATKQFKQLTKRVIKKEI